MTSLHLRSGFEDPDSAVPLAPVEASFPMPSRRVTGKRPLGPHEVRPEQEPPEQPEVPLDSGNPSGHVSGHHEAAGVWTDEKGPAVRFLGEHGPCLMAYKAFEYHPEPPEVSLDSGECLA